MNQSFIKKTLAGIIASLTIATLAGAAPPPPNSGGKVPHVPLAPLKFTSVSYTQDPSNPQYIKVIINGTGNAPGCIANIMIGPYSVGNHSFSALPETLDSMAPPDGANIFVSPVSGCAAGSASTIFHNVKINPNLVSAITSLALVNNVTNVIKQGDGPSALLIHTTLGQSTCLLLYSIDGKNIGDISIAAGQTSSGLTSGVQGIKLGLYPIGSHVITVKGGAFDVPSAPPCRGELSLTFTVQ